MSVAGLALRVTSALTAAEKAFAGMDFVLHALALATSATLILMFVFVNTSAGAESANLNVIVSSAVASLVWNPMYALEATFAKSLQMGLAGRGSILVRMDTLAVEESAGGPPLTLVECVKVVIGARLDIPV